MIFGPTTELPLPAINCPKLPSSLLPPRAEPPVSTHLLSLRPNWKSVRQCSSCRSSSSPPADTTSAVAVSSLGLLPSISIPKSTRARRRPTSVPLRPRQLVESKRQVCTMSGGVETIAGAVVQHVAGKLGQIAQERIELIWNFKEDVDDMKGKMDDLQVALNSAEKRSQGNEDELVRHWLKKYKSVAHEIEDTLDELHANEMIWKNSPCTVKLFFSSFNPLIVRITMPNKMKNIRVKLDKIVEEQKKFNFPPVSASTGQAKNEKWRETFVGDKEEIEMVGREKEKKDILNKVLQKDQQNSIIPVVGLGGMGKTTLAKFVYNDKETRVFDVKAWVYVSDNFELNKIVAAIISQVEGSTPAKDTDLQYLKTQLDRIFCDKFYLIVLDDLWEDGEQELEKLLSMLQSGKKGSKIIVTTRNEKVATTLRTLHTSSFHTVAPTILEGLPYDECWYIMKPPSLGDGQFIDLVDIGQEIAKRCNGVPLVAKALGYMMRKHCTKEAWLDIRDSDILDLKDGGNVILKGLMLSYYYMAPQLKLCFIYCSIFPKSHDIDRDCLIQQWIALGLIQDTDGRPLHTVGGEHIDDFLGMSFLTTLGPPAVPATGIFKPTLKFRMHDMVHDLARYVAGDELLYLNAVAKSKKTDNRNCLYQLFINHNEASSTYKALPTKVRVLHFRECGKMHLPKQAFSHSLRLRILDLSGCHVSELPSSVSKLKLLRYLDASNLPITNLRKSLNNLQNMQTLILSNTSLKTLPLNIGCLQKLQYFDLSSCVNLQELPTSFGNLSDLLFLNLASCHELQTLPESFGNLRTLQFLNLSDCYKLHSLPDSCCQLRGLTHFDLSDCHNLGKLPECIGELSKLEYLNLTSCSKVEMLPESLCKLVKLKHLNLSFCVKLEYLPSCIGVLQLKTLDIQGCFWLDELPDSIFNMSTLENLEAALVGVVQRDVDRLKEHLELQGSSQLDGGSGDLWSQIVDLEKTHCHELVINGLENVEHLEEAGQAKLSNNSKLRRLELTWEHDQDSLEKNTGANKDKSMLQKLVPPRSLEHLALRGYMSVDFPSWMFDIASYLPHLTIVELANLKGCSCLPPLGRLLNLRALIMGGMPNIRSIGKEFYGDYGTCQKLRIILLQSMDNLEEWWATRSSNEDGEFLIPNLHYLAVFGCPKLKFLPHPPRSVIWGLVNSDDVLPERGFGSLSSTTSPFFLEIVASTPSSFWRIQYLSSLEILVLKSITGLGTLPEAIRLLTSLRVLVLTSCQDLETLPEWLGDLTSLREIGISDCPKLSSLPESIRRLTELKFLRIIGCRTLSERCQGEDQHKIAHIPEVKYE